MNYAAVYRDQHGQNYSCPVVENNGAWSMLTSDGPQPIAIHFQDDRAGTLTFVEYREEKDSRIHVEKGESFRVLQEAGARARAADLASRQHARQQALQELNQPDVKKSREIRRLNNVHAQQMRSRGGGEYVIRKSGE